MPIDSFTILLFGLFIKLVLGALFAVFWLKNRAAPWFAWWEATLLLGSVTSILYMLRGADSFISVGIGNAFLVASMACAWQGARAFDLRRPLWSPVLLAPVLWLAACSVPDFLANVAYRIVLSSCLLAPMLAMAAVEFWRGRRERLPSRWPVIVIFASFALFFALRIPSIGLLPFPFGALPMELGWLGAFNLTMLAHTILLSVLLVSLSKERLEYDQRTKEQTDPLTGALNRRAFMSRGARLLQRHTHERAPLCLLVTRPRSFQVAQRPVRPFRRRRRARELRRPGEWLNQAFGFPVPDRRRGILLLLVAHHHRAGAPGGRAHPSPVRDDDGKCGGRAGKGDREPRHSLDRCLWLRTRYADAASRHGGFCRQARRPQPGDGGVGE